MEEKWRDVVGGEGKYQVSSIGRVKSLSRWTFHKDDTRRYFQQGKLMKLGKDKKRLL